MLLRVIYLNGVNQAMKQYPISVSEEMEEKISTYAYNNGLSKAAVCRLALSRLFRSEGNNEHTET